MWGGRFHVAVTATLKVLKKAVVARAEEEKRQESGTTASWMRICKCVEKGSFRTRYKVTLQRLVGGRGRRGRSGEIEYIALDGVEAVSASATAIGARPSVPPPSSTSALLWTHPELGGGTGVFPSVGASNHEWRTT